ncbi:MAG TPA: asparagine synthetase B [Candidatus Latescibacteria bacterium]|nr:asparagine synthetase B [Candidatus Latescibacterota bacterium]
MKKALLLFIILLSPLSLTSYTGADRILVNMDYAQADHLKAYGLAYWALEKGINVEWLLNFRGGSFLMEYSVPLVEEARVRGVSFEVIGQAKVSEIHNRIEEENMEAIVLEKAPKIAVYIPPSQEAWDDAVRLALDYAEIPYEILWDREVLEGRLAEYDWLHLHHEDFTGQYGKFYASYRNAPWYIQMQKVNEQMASELGFTKVSELKKAVARRIYEYVKRGGFLFAMCSAPETLDIALAAAGVDIVPPLFDGDPVDSDYQSRLDFSRTFAFENFHLEINPLIYAFSDIDTTPESLKGIKGAEADSFTLFEFSAKYDPVPTMLTQNHTPAIKGFLGQTTGFRKELIKKSVVILGEVKGTDEVKYIHGNLGKGTFTFYGGHDPEDYMHLVGDPPTDLTLHKNSPGYRLILNNILFPAAKKEKMRT